MDLLALINEAGGALRQMRLDPGAERADVAKWILQCRVLLSARVSKERAVLHKPQEDHVLLRAGLGARCAVLRPYGPRACFDAM